MDWASGYYKPSVTEEIDLKADGSVAGAGDVVGGK
jgi:hypothetical protein